MLVSVSGVDCSYAAVKWHILTPDELGGAGGSKQNTYDRDLLAASPAPPSGVTSRPLDTIATPISHTLPVLTPSADLGCTSSQGPTH